MFILRAFPDVAVGYPIELREWVQVELEKLHSSATGVQVQPWTRPRSIATPLASFGASTHRLMLLFFLPRDCVLTSGLLLIEDSGICLTAFLSTGVLLSSWIVSCPPYNPSSTWLLSGGLF